MIKALGILKKSAALANAELGELPADIAELIAKPATRSSPVTSTPSSRSWSSRPARAPSPT